MTLNTSTYKRIFSEVASTPCSAGDLQILKVFFRDKINSTRRLDHIQNVQQLIKTLEKRDEVNENTLTCLEQIARSLNRQDLLCLINVGLNPQQRVQQRVDLPTQPTLNRQLPSQATVLNLKPVTARERVHELIINEIGSKWKDLARNMDIGEGKIDELEERYRYDPAERVRKVLLFHERTTPRNSVHFSLPAALGKSRRNDLRERVERIYSDFS